MPRQRRGIPGRGQLSGSPSRYEKAPSRIPHSPHWAIKIPSMCPRENPALPTCCPGELKTIIKDSVNPTRIFLLSLAPHLTPCGPRGVRHCTFQEEDGWGRPRISAPAPLLLQRVRSSGPQLKGRRTISIRSWGCFVTYSDPRTLITQE